MSLTVSSEAPMNPLSPFGRSVMAGDVSQPSVLSSPPTPLALIMALRRRWFLALCLAVPGAVLGAFIGWLLFPPTWKATTSLHIASARPIILSETPEGRSEFSSFQRSQVELVRSRLVLNAVLRNPAISSLPLLQSQDNPVEWLRKELRVDFASSPEILSITMMGDQPDSMTRLVNAVRAAYENEFLNKEQRVRLKRLDDLQRTYDVLDDGLRKKQKQLRELAEQLGSKKSESLNLKTKNLYEQLGRLQNEHWDTEQQVGHLKVALQVLQDKHKGLLERGVQQDAVEDKLKQHPDMLKLQTPLAEIGERIRFLKERLINPDRDPDVLALNRALIAAENSLELRRRELRPVVGKQLLEDLLSVTAANLTQEKDKLVLAEKREKMVKEKVDKKTAEVLMMGTGGVNLEYLEEEINQDLDLYKKVAVQKAALKIELDAPSRVSLLEDGYVVQTRNNSNRLVRAGISGMGVFVVAVLVVGFLEFRARRVNTFGEVVFGLGLPLLGVLPRVPARALGHSGSPRDTYWQQALGDAIATTRTMLVHAARNESLRVVMVTSAMEAEGKTLLSSRLAIDMAMAGFKTLIIDTDLHRSSIHGLFELPAAPGLSELLRNQADLQSVLHPGPLPGLTVMTAGRWDSSIVRLLAQQRLGEVLEGLKQVYDFIILDSAPILPSNDTLLIAQHTDGVLMSVLCDVSRLPMVHLAYARMAMLGVRMLGAVIGGEGMGSYGYGYGYSSQMPTSR